MTERRCSVPGCSALSATTLRAKPSGLNFPPSEPEQVDFDFCVPHADEYGAKGYESDGPDQLEMR